MNDRSQLRDEEGSALIVALAFLSLFGVVAAAVLGLVDTSLRSSTSREDLRAAEYAADGATELAVEAMRLDPSRGTAEGPSCDAALPGAGSTPAATVACTPDSDTGEPLVDRTTLPWAVLALGQRSGSPAPYNGSNPVDPGQAEAGVRMHRAGATSETGGAVIDGAVTANSTVVAQGATTLAAKGNLRARVGCQGAVSEQPPGTGGPQCGGGGTAVADPDLPHRTDVGPVQPVPTCPADPNDRLVSFLPGRYVDAVALNTLFTTCTDHDFWFTPGAYLFNFANSATTDNACPLGGPAAVNGHRWCIGVGSSADPNDARVVGGTPRGWNPHLATEQSTLRPQAAASAQPWGVTLDQGRIIDGTVAASTWSAGGAPTLLANVATSTASNGTDHFATVANGRIIGGGTTATTWATATSTPNRAATATSTDYANPTRAIITEGTANPQYADDDIVALPASSSLTLSGYTTPVPTDAAVVGVGVRVRYRVSNIGRLADPRLTITPGGGGAACADLTVARPANANEYASITVDASTCLNTVAKINGATARLTTTRSGTQAVDVRVDGIEIDTYYALAATRGVTLSSLQAPIPDPVDTITNVQLRVAHREDAGSNPRIRVTGSTTCGPIALTVRNTLTTDTVDLSACLNTAAKVNGANIVYEVTRPPGALLTPTATLDGMSLSLTHASADRVLTLSNQQTALPDPVRTINNASLRIAHSETVGTTPRVRVVPGGGGSCILPLPQRTTLTTDTVDLTTCLNTAAKLNGATVSYEVARGTVTTATARLDGTDLVVTYRRLADRIPADLSGCDPGQEGVQLIFAGDSRVELSNGTMALCAGPNDAGTGDTGQRIALFGMPIDAPSSSTFTPGSGCVTTATLTRDNYWDGLGNLDCAVLKYGDPTGPEKAQVSVLGTVYAPSAAVDMDDSDLRAPAFNRSVVVRHLRINRWALRSGYTGAVISDGGGSSAADREATLVASVLGRDVLRTVVRIDATDQVAILERRILRA